MATKDGASEPLRRTLRALRRAYDDAVTEVDATPDAKRAYDGATMLAEQLRDAADEAARLRTRQAARIYNEQHISLATLAEYLGVSKARAGQMVDAARKDKQPRRGR